MEDPTPEQVEAPEGGCGPWEAHAGASSWPDLWTRGERSPRQSRFAGRTCDPVGDPMLEQFVPEVNKGSDRAAPVGTWPPARVNPPQKGRSCLTNLIFYDKVTRLVDEGDNMDVVYLDFEKPLTAFPATFS
ncbi:zinc finger and BTB domain-containing protein 5 [Grus japonensis]|uniref:Zinc finger and BTB domain-containing protein 5 n=1 Tax=Grus japonensis TaxID=30415 RepID=A0ABC9W2L3_GRUJA